MSSDSSSDSNSSEAARLREATAMVLPSRPAAAVCAPTADAQDEVAVRVARRRLDIILQKQMDESTSSNGHLEEASALNEDEEPGIRLFASSSVRVSSSSAAAEPAAQLKRRRQESSSSDEASKIRAAAVSVDWVLSQAAPLAHSELKEKKKKKKRNDDEGGDDEATLEAAQENGRDHKAKTKKKKHKHSKELIE